jgi:hypothetical protein
MVWMQPARNKLYRVFISDECGLHDECCFVMSYDVDERVIKYLSTSAIFFLEGKQRFP